MTLVDRMMEDVCMVDKRSVPDGLGSFKADWVDGATFQAAIVKNSSMQAKIAEKQGVTEVYTVTFKKGLPIAYHDVIKRKSDGLVLRVTSNVTDSETPKIATFQYGQVTAERWELV